jgi:anti-sigma B factor antagonist
MQEARFPVEVVGGVPVVIAPEEIDITNAVGLQAALLDTAINGHRRFVVDMTRTRFCDSSGVHALAAAHRRALEEDRQLLLAVSGPAVLRVLAITGIDQIIPSFASLDEALGQAWSGGAPGSRRGEPPWRIRNS